MNRFGMGRLASLLGVRPRASGLQASVPSVGDAAGVGALDRGLATAAVDVLGTATPTPAAVVEAIAATAGAAPLSESERLERWYVEDQVRRDKFARTKVEASARMEANEVIRAVSEAAAGARQRAAAQLLVSASATPRAPAPVAAAPRAPAPAPAPVAIAPAPVAPVAAYAPPPAPTYTAEQRAAAILSHPLAFGRQALAEHIVGRTAASPAEAAAILAAAPRDEVLVAAYHGAAGERAARGMAPDPARDAQLARGISSFLSQPLLVDQGAAATEAEEYERGAEAARRLLRKG